MLMLITYDVATNDTAGRRRLRRVARLCQDHGQRVQYSVFECQIDPAQWTVLRTRLIEEIDEDEDSLRFYRLGANWRPRIEHVGTKPTYDPDGPLVY
ncbi:MAG: CRISPR-associated endonuclease Cas2 [Gammaproteobacteria bacterium]|nr:CRISPR-associated endonuclease Cas2 [Gammaproteobacteria bacterium]